MYTIFGQLNKASIASTRYTVARLHTRTGVSYMITFDSDRGTADCVSYSY